MLTIDDDVFKVAKSLAEARATSVGSVVSELARRGIRSMRSLGERNGSPVFAVSTGLLDVNVLVALAWPSHAHHEAAHRWFAEYGSDGWATCPVTQLAFVRVSSNPSVIAEAVSPQEALGALRSIVSHPSHVFWAEGTCPASDCADVFGLVAGHRQLTDAYLLSLAMHMRGTLVALDGGIRNLLPAGRDPRSLLTIDA